MPNRPRTIQLLEVGPMINVNHILGVIRTCQRLLLFTGISDYVRLILVSNLEKMKGETRMIEGVLWIH
jgi:hypothetical protein